MKHGGIAEILRTKQFPGMATAAESWRRGLPMESCGVGRVQLPQAIRQLEEAVGHPVEWKRDRGGGGCPVPHGNPERNEILKALNMRDNDAGYSQHAGK